MNAENFEAFIERMENAAASSVKIDVDPNWFNGSCIKASDKVNIYLVMKGEKRFIPNINTYNNLFKDSSNILDGGRLGPLWNKVVEGIPQGDNITDGAILIKATNSDPTYLLTNNKKYWITTKELFNNCNFNNSKINQLPAIVVDAIPTGENDVFKPTKM